jgi:hypothetical protein
LKRLNSDALQATIHEALEEVSRWLASAEPDGSGRFHTDEELTAGAATGRVSESEKSSEAPAA